MYNKETDNIILELNHRLQNITESSYFQKVMKRKEIQEYIRNMRFDILIRKFTSAILPFRKIKNQNSHIIESNNAGEYPKNKSSNIVVYSCIIGSYDKVINPLYKEPGIRYIMFTDSNTKDTLSWEKIDIKIFPDLECLSPKEVSRKLKMLPYNYLPECDYSLYVDGNVEIVAAITPLIEEMGEAGIGLHYHKARDCIYEEAKAVISAVKANRKKVNEQMKYYKSIGYPAHNKLYENTILIRNHHDKIIRALMESWWEEYLKFPTRDQLSLPVLIWKSKIDNIYVHILGNNIDLNPRFNRKKDHMKNNSLWESIF